MGPKHARARWRRELIIVDCASSMDAGDEVAKGVELPPVFKGTIGYKSQLLSRLLQADYLSHIASTGIAPAQAYVLGELWIEEPLSQVELARRLEIGKASTGKTLGRLEASGFIERRRNDVDRRVVTVHLTTKGRALRRDLLQAADEQDERVHAALGEEKLQEMVELLDTLIDRFRSAQD